MPEDSVPAPDGETKGGAGAEPFPTFAALQRAHLDFRQAFSKRAKDAKSGSSTADDIRALLARVRATGAVIDDKNERKAAQGILDYWNAELVSSPGATADDFMPALLARFAGRTAGATKESAASAKAVDERSRDVIRIAAAARLWRDSGKKKGYLLWGEDEIAQAAQYRDLDPDIAELVKASKIAGKKYAFNTYTFLFVVAAVLAGLLVTATWGWMDARSQANRLEAESRELGAQSDEYKAAHDQARNALNAARTSAESADKIDRRLEAALTVLRRLAERNVITRADLPEEVATAVFPTAAPQPDLRPAPTQDQTAAGYDPAFLLVSIPLPGLTPQRRRADYQHYSVVLDTGRRLAAVAASNLDREKRVVLPRAAMGFAPDPNLPPDVQADPNWFKSDEIDHGHLVTRQEISWGPAFTGNDPELSRKLVGMVNVLTNVAPQFDTFNRYVWSDLEEWILTEHNKRAARVAIFTGPVLEADDPVIDGGRVPRRFWKIAVSRKAPGAPELIVDAFMISQFQEGTNEKIGRTEFMPETFRVKVSEIERVTGLDFGPAVREAMPSDAVDSPAPAVEQRPDVTVYFQFAGMSRNNAVGISNRLKALGWKIPGEERTGAAAKQNEVRYGAETDRAAADILVADLKALGLTRMSAKRNASIKPGFVEIWVSQ